MLDIAAQVAVALEPKPSLWWQYAARLFTFLSGPVKEEDQSSAGAAALNWIYKDDADNMPVHYIALGGKPNMWGLSPPLSSVS
jgi:hypothetical protein